MKYPECEKLQAVSEKSQCISEFIEWLETTKNVQLSQNVDDYYRWLDTPIDQLTAEFFNIDLNKVERERKHMLERCRIMNANG